MSVVVADLIRSHLGNLTPSERKIARALQADYPRAGLETALRLAERAGVSAPTVVRFVTKLGFGGYPEFQERLRGEVAARAVSPLMQYSTEPAAPTEGALGRSARVLREGIEATFAGLDADQFEAAVGAICASGKRVVTVGGRYSTVVSQYLFTHLQLLRPGARGVSSAAMERMGALLDIGRRDVVVAYDFRRYQEDTVAFGEIASEQGATVILITDPWLSPLAGRAEVILPCSVLAPSPFDALTPAMAVTEALIAAVVDRLGESPRPRINRFEEIAGHPLGR